MSKASIYRKPDLSPDMRKALNDVIDAMIDDRHVAYGSTFTFTDSLGRIRRLYVVEGAWVEERRR